MIQRKQMSVTGRTVQIDRLIVSDRFIIYIINAL